MFPNSANSSLCLLTIVNESDALGIGRPTIKDKKEAIGSVRSITSSEYQTAAMLNVRSELKVVLQCFLYEGQKFAAMNGKVYKVDRTYQSGQFIEIYLSTSDYSLEELGYGGDAG